MLPLCCATPHVLNLGTCQLTLLGLGKKSWPVEIRTQDLREILPRNRLESESLDQLEDGVAGRRVVVLAGESGGSVDARNDGRRRRRRHCRQRGLAGKLSQLRSLTY